MSGDGEKPYDPTPSKLEKAREKGEVARSSELNTFAAYIGCLVMFTMVLPVVMYRVLDAGGGLISRASSIDMASAGALALWEITIGATILVAVPMILVMIAIIIQRSAVFSPTRLMPKASRISIISGFKNKFGAGGLFEFSKSGIKMCLYTALLAAFLWVSADMVAASSMLPVGQSYTLLSRTISMAVILVIGIAAVLALADVAWQRHSHLSKNRMSRQELQDEMKEAEGDPHFKAKRQQRGRELASNRMLDDVPKATVIIVNPTHYAVALQWSAADLTPPICLAKGIDELAARIREVGINAGVPVFSDPPTTRALFATVDVGASITRAHFKAVAAAIRFSEDLKRGESRR